MPRSVSDGGVEPPQRPFRRRILINTAATGASNVWAIAATLVTLPIVVHGLGAAMFGRWVLLQTLSASTGWLVILDAGLGASVTRAVAGGAAVGDRDAQGRTIGTGLAMFAFVAAGGAVLTATLGWPVLRHLARVPAAAAHQAHVAVLVLVVQVAAELLLQGSEACLEGLQRVDLSRWVEMVLRTFFVIGTAVAATVTHHIDTVEIAAAGATSIAAVLGGVVLWAQVRGVRLRWSTSELRAIAAYAGVVALLRPISALFHLMNRVIVGVVLGPAAVALVEVATQLQNGVSAVLSSASYAVMPGSAWLEARGDTGAIRRMVEDGTRFVLLATLPVAIGVAMLSREGIGLWVGHSYLGAAGPASIAALSMGVAAVGMPGANVLMGTGRAAVCVRAESLAIAVNLGASIVLVHTLGVPGVFWGTTISYAITTPWFLIAVCRQVGIPTMEVVRMTVRRLAPPVLAEAAVVEAVRVLRLGSLPTILLAAVAGGASFALVALRWSLEPGELSDLVPGLLRRRGRGGPAVSGPSVPE